MVHFYSSFTLDFFNSTDKFGLKMVKMVQIKTWMKVCLDKEKYSNKKVTNDKGGKVLITL